MVPQLVRVTEEYSVRVYSSSGFDSLTAKKNLADRICEEFSPAVILHLGDYDPSGVSIFDCMAEDVAAFVKEDRRVATTTVKFKRVALTEALVRMYKLHTAPAKASDSRSKSWKGETCQLEAMAPDLIAQILDAELKKLFDPKKLKWDREQEEIARRSIALALPAPEQFDGEEPQ
jgi:hypothetical protein